MSLKNEAKLYVAFAEANEIIVNKIESLHTLPSFKNELERTQVFSLLICQLLRLEEVLGNSVYKEMSKYYNDFQINALISMSKICHLQTKGEPELTPDSLRLANHVIDKAKGKV